LFLKCLLASRLMLFRLTNTSNWCKQLNVLGVSPNLISCCTFKQ
jgi:hypothetical protein